jgi:hypothetical protein
VGTVNVSCESVFSVSHQVEAIFCCLTKKFFMQLGPGSGQGLEVTIKGVLYRVKVEFHSPKGEQQ